jgi:hypothetical protein
MVDYLELGWQQQPGQELCQFAVERPYQEARERAEKHTYFSAMVNHRSTAVN